MIPPLSTTKGSHMAETGMTKEQMADAMNRMEQDKRMKDYEAMMKKMEKDAKKKKASDKLTGE